jgi:hypothetical protein
MKCDHCGKEMEEKTLFTSIEYNCKRCSSADDGWQTPDEVAQMISPMDLPLKLKFKDEDGTEGGVFIGDMNYFTRCPKGRKFKIQGILDPYLGVKKWMTPEEAAEALYGYPITRSDDSEDDGC